MWQKFLFKIVFFSGLFFFQNNLQAQTGTFYVSPTGSDSNSGTIDNPWKTIRNAAQKLTAGQVAYVRGGTYYEKITFQHSGYENNWIKLCAYPGEEATINGNGKSGNFIIDLNRKSYIEIKGLKLINGTEGIGNGESHIIIDGNTIKNCTNPGIHLAYCSFAKVRNNITDNVCSNSWGECITFDQCEYVDVSYNEVKNSLTSERGGEGIDVKASKHVRVFGNKVHNLRRLGIYIDSYGGQNKDVKVFNNTVYGTSSGIIVSSEMQNSLEDIHIFNNVVYDIASYGIAVVNWPTYPTDFAYPIENLSIEHNTIIASPIVIDAPQGNNFSIRNNIIYDADIKIENRPRNLMLKNNIANVGSQANISASCIIANPKFVSLSQNDYHLQENSPAIDNADSSGVDLDHDFLERVSTEANDIGAFEYGASDSVSIDPQNKPDNSTLYAEILDANDDGYEETETGEVRLNTSKIEIGTTNPLDKKIGACRFDDIDIPRGARILNSYIRFYMPGSAAWNTYPIKIYAENTGDAAELENSPYSLSSKQATRNKAYWLIVSENTQRGWKQTPSLDDVLTEIVNRSDWEEGNAITFLLEYDNTFIVKLNALESGYEYVPQLVIEYIEDDSKSIFLSPTSVSLNRNETAQLTSSSPDATWTTTGNSIVKVDQNGKITYLKDGEAEVYAVAPDGTKSLPCKVRCFTEINDLYINPKYFSLEKEGTKRLWVDYSPSVAIKRAIVWFSENDNIATVDAEGLVTAKNPGITNIIASTLDGKHSTTAQLTVNSITGIEDFTDTNDGILLYPNPGKDVVFVKFEKPVYKQFAVLDSTGREIKTGNIPQQKTQFSINIDGLKPGVYVLRVSNGQKEKNLKLNVQ